MRQCADRTLSFLPVTLYLPLLLLAALSERSRHCPHSARLVCNSSCDPASFYLQRSVPHRSECRLTRYRQHTDIYFTKHFDFFRCVTMVALTHLHMFAFYPLSSLLALGHYTNVLTLACVAFGREKYLGVMISHVSLKELPTTVSRTMKSITHYSPREECTTFDPFGRVLESA